MPVYRIHSRRNPERHLEATRAERRAKRVAVALSVLFLAYTIYCVVDGKPRRGASATSLTAESALSPEASAGHR